MYFHYLAVSGLDDRIISFGKQIMEDENPPPEVESASPASSESDKSFILIDQEMAQKEVAKEAEVAVSTQENDKKVDSIVRGDIGKLIILRMHYRYQGPCRIASYRSQDILIANNEYIVWYDKKNIFCSV